MKLNKFDTLCEGIIADLKKGMKQDLDSLSYRAGDLVPGIKTMVKDTKEVVKDFFTSKIEKNKTYVFMLPLKNRPAEYSKIHLQGKYWHVGIIQDGIVYEAFSDGKFQTNDFRPKDPKYKDMEFIEIEKIPVKQLHAVGLEKLPCDNYVNKVLGFELTKEKDIVKVNFPK